MLCRVLSHNRTGQCYISPLRFESYILKTRVQKCNQEEASTPKHQHIQTHLRRLFQRLGLGLGLRRVLLHLLALGAIRLLLR
jgi:hypothetical protein